MIDDIETGLHKKYYDILFPVVFALANKLNVQLFIATHSIEAIDAILRYGNYDNNHVDNDPIKFITLKKVNENNFSRSLYLKINDDEIEEINKKIINKYKEDRIRYLDKILNCEVICVNLSETISEYYIENNKAYITLLINSYDQKFSYDEKKFLETLIFEYLKYNKIKSNNTKYYPELIALYSDFLNNIMIIPINCLSVLIEAKNKNYRYNKELDNMTINDYQLSLVKKIM